MKTYHIISNPAAGKKKSLKNLATVEKFFAAKGVAFETHLSVCERDATSIARRLTENGATEIVTLGGDGTLHEVLNGLKDPSACNLGLIPSGTGNDFAERIGIPMEAEKAASLILNGEAKSTDYLEMDGVRCMNVAGIGMDVDVLQRCKKGKLKGKIKYLLSLVQSLFAFKGIKVKIESEGREEERSVLLAGACNGSQFGGGIRICPVAEVDDKKLDAVIVDCIGGKLKIIKAFMELMKGRILQYPAATHFLCDRLKFIPQKPCPAQLDGEIYTGLNFDISIKSGLKFYR
ncbi:MAG: YegS/Rv2252/BmrU family lipid kinase [Clostridia bacterium]|nr:YegS/Rv2252/BmrU family lipid kinase [Clostridia bacterium]